MQEGLIQAVGATITSEIDCPLSKPRGIISARFESKPCSYIHDERGVLLVRPHSSERVVRLLNFTTRSATALIDWLYLPKLGYFVASMANSTITIWNALWEPITALATQTYVLTLGVLDKYLVLGSREGVQLLALPALDELVLRGLVSELSSKDIVASVPNLYAAGSESPKEGWIYRVIPVSTHNIIVCQLLSEIVVLSFRPGEKALSLHKSSHTIELLSTDVQHSDDAGRNLIARATAFSRMSGEVFRPEMELDLKGFADCSPSLIVRDRFTPLSTSTHIVDILVDAIQGIVVVCGSDFRLRTLSLTGNLMTDYARLPAKATSLSWHPSSKQYFFVSLSTGAIRLYHTQLPFHLSQSRHADLVKIVSSHSDRFYALHSRAISVMQPGAAPSLLAIAHSRFVSISRFPYAMERQFLGVTEDSYFIIFTIGGTLVTRFLLDPKLGRVNPTSYCVHPRSPVLYVAAAVGSGSRVVAVALESRAVPAVAESIATSTVVSSFSESTDANPSQTLAVFSYEQFVVQSLSIVPIDLLISDFGYDTGDGAAAAVTVRNPMALGCIDGRLVFAMSQSGTYLFSFQRHVGSVEFVEALTAPSPIGNSTSAIIFASASIERLCLWAVDEYSRIEVHSWFAFSSKISVLTAFDDGFFVGFDSGNCVTILISDLPEAYVDRSLGVPTVELPLPLHPHPVLSVDFAPTTRCILTLYASGEFEFARGDSGEILRSQDCSILTSTTVTGYFDINSDYSVTAACLCAGPGEVVFSWDQNVFTYTDGALYSVEPTFKLISDYELPPITDPTKIDAVIHESDNSKLSELIRAASSSLHSKRKPLKPQIISSVLSARTKPMDPAPPTKSQLGLHHVVVTSTGNSPEIRKVPSIDEIMARAAKTPTLTVLQTAAFLDRTELISEIEAERAKKRAEEEQVALEQAAAERALADEKEKARLQSLRAAKEPESFDDCFANWDEASDDTFENGSVFESGALPDGPSSVQPRERQGDLEAMAARFRVRKPSVDPLIIGETLKSAAKQHSKRKSARRSARKSAKKSATARLISNFEFIPKSGRVSPADRCDDDNCEIEAVHELMGTIDERFDDMQPSLDLETGSRAFPSRRGSLINPEAKARRKSILSRSHEKPKPLPALPSDMRSSSPTIPTVKIDEEAIVGKSTLDDDESVCSQGDEPDDEQLKSQFLQEASAILSIEVSEASSCGEDSSSEDEAGVQPWVLTSALFTPVTLSPQGSLSLIPLDPSLCASTFASPGVSPQSHSASETSHFAQSSTSDQCSTAVNSRSETPLQASTPAPKEPLLIRDSSHGSKDSLWRTTSGSRDSLLPAPPPPPPKKEGVRPRTVSITDDLRSRSRPISESRPRTSGSSVVVVPRPAVDGDSANSDIGELADATYPPKTALDLTPPPAQDDPVLSPLLSPSGVKDIGSPGVFDDGESEEGVADLPGLTDADFTLSFQRRPSAVLAQERLFTSPFATQHSPKPVHTSLKNSILESTFPMIVSSTKKSEFLTSERPVAAFAAERSTCSLRLQTASDYLKASQSLNWPLVK